MLSSPYIFMQNVIKLNAAVYELSCKQLEKQKKERKTMLKTILPSLLLAVINTRSNNA